jgi:hypothetical protein
MAVALVETLMSSLFEFSGWREDGMLDVAKTDHESSMRWPRRARM